MLLYRHIHFQWMQQDLEIVGHDFFFPQSLRRFGIGPLLPSWTVNTVQPEFTGGRGVCWPRGLVSGTWVREGGRREEEEKERCRG